MSYSTVTHNIIQSLFTLSDSDAIAYVLYDDTNSIFDKAIRECEKLCVVSHNNFNPNISYDIYWSNDPTGHTSHVEQVKKSHLHDVVYFRNPSEQAIKKEDKFLIQNRFRLSYQISRTRYIQNDWNIEKQAPILEYGIPNVNLDDSNRDKSVILLNTTNNKNIINLYGQILKYWPDATMLNNIQDMDYQTICEVLQKHKLCIEIQDSYNILFGIANGCRVLSMNNQDNADICLLSEIDSLIPQIREQLLHYEEYPREKNSRAILDKYNFSVFEMSTYQLIRSILQTPVII